MSKEKCLCILPFGTTECIQAQIFTVLEHLNSTPAYQQCVTAIITSSNYPPANEDRIQRYMSSYTQ